LQPPADTFLGLQIHHKCICSPNREPTSLPKQRSSGAFKNLREPLHGEGKGPEKGRKKRRYGKEEERKEGNEDGENTTEINPF